MPESRYSKITLCARAIYWWSRKHGVASWAPKWEEASPRIKRAWIERAEVFLSDFSPEQPKQPNE